ncbi:MAG: hypothetical protein AB8G99_24790 [Planctomycetaceae bacterium]
MERKLVSAPVGWTMLLLRMAVLATLFLTVLQPVLTWSLDKTTRPQILVALDLSESMSTADKQASQAEKLRWARALGMYGNAATETRIDRWLAAFEEGREPQWVDPDETQDPIRKSELATTRKENLQGVFDELGRLSRREIAMRLLTKTANPLLKQLEEVGNTRITVFAEESQATDADGLRGFASEPPISLGTGLSSLSSAMLAGDPPLAGIVLLTDGRDTSDTDPVNIAGQLGVIGAPVCPVALGSIYRPRDLSIGTIDYPQTVFLDDKAVLSAQVLAFGFDNEEVTVALEKDGELVEEKTVATVDGGANVDFNLDASEEARHQYTLTVRPEEGETREDNNVSAFAMTVVDDRAQVLLIEGESRWEFRFLHRALDRDERVQETSVVFEQPYIEQLNSSFFATEINVPTDVTKIDESPLADVDVVIIGDVAPEKLTDDLLRLLDRYVSELGGTVVFQAGKRFMPMAYDNELLSKLLPIQKPAEVNMKAISEARSPRERGMHLFITAEALDEAMFQFVEDRFANRRFWQSLPGHSWAVVSEVKPGANVFACVADAAEQQDLEYERKNALIAHQFYGFGQVLWMGIDSTWRWRFREGDRYHHRFWGQLARWAASNKASAGNDSVRLKLSSTELKQGEDLEVKALWSSRAITQNPNTRATAVVKRIDGDNPDQVFAQVQLEPEEGRTRSHSAKILSPPAGAYRVELLIDGQQPDEPIDADFYVEEEKSLELSDVSCNRELLQQIADASGGKLFNADEVSEIVKMFTTKEQKQTETLETSVWDHWTMMLLFFVLLTTEWVVRKLNGLP